MDHARRAVRNGKNRIVKLPFAKNRWQSKDPIQVDCFPFSRLGVEVDVKKTLGSATVSIHALARLARFHKLRDQELGVGNDIFPRQNVIGASWSPMTKRDIGMRLSNNLSNAASRYNNAIKITCYEKEHFFLFA